MAKKDLDAFKEGMKSLQRRSGSTVCSEASTGVGLGGSGTFARPLALASRFSFSYSRERWNLKDGSQTFNSVATRGSRTPRFQIS